MQILNDITYSNDYEINNNFIVPLTRIGYDVEDVMDDVYEEFALQYPTK